MTRDEAISIIEKYIKKSKHTSNEESLDFLNDSLHTISIDDYSFIFRELTWKEALIFDAVSYRKKSDELYFSSESEKNIFYLML